MIDNDDDDVVMAKVREGIQHELHGEMVVVSADAEFNRTCCKRDAAVQEQPAGTLSEADRDFSLSLLMGDSYRHKKAILLAFFNKFRAQAGLVHDIQSRVEGVMASWSKGGAIYAREDANKGLIELDRATLHTRLGSSPECHSGVRLCAFASVSSSAGPSVSAAAPSEADRGKGFSFYVIVKKAMGITTEDPEAEQLLRDYMTLYKRMHALPINLPGTAHREALKARASIVKIIKKKLDERKAKESVDEEDDDLLGCLIKASTYTWENICDTIQGFIFGGLITSSTAICVAMYFLERCPKALEQMREEHLECMRLKKENGERKLTWDDYRNMNFTQNVISETLRLGNVAPSLFRKALKDVEFKGYFIPEGTTVITIWLLYIWNPLCLRTQSNSIHGDECKGCEEAKQPSPFGSGVRQCMGSELARVELSIFLHHLILNYDWESVEPDHPVSVPLDTKDVKKASNLLPFGGGHVRHCMGSELATVEISILLHFLMLSYDWEFVDPDHPISIPHSIWMVQIDHAFDE
uniref:Uncharacterized protein n=1 Tax=Ananas comosus var. bracteatus TaxID=296719 RepID=A0A6V7QLG3_ANACO|nr:unnamed protein product [Ananas comosus var. bracteatus]